VTYLSPPHLPLRQCYRAHSRATGRLIPGRFPSPVPQGERKTVTALFADITGSTKMMHDLDPEEARAIIDPAIQPMIKAVKSQDNHIFEKSQRVQLDIPTGGYRNFRAKG
jgi:class 3 adenylate cyclase